MDAAPLLSRIARLLEKHRLEAILIGNAAAALQGAPVSTRDIDFLFRDTAANVKKLKALADDLDAVVLKPFYPVSRLYRIARDEDGLQIDFMSAIHGIRSFESLRKHATTMLLGDTRIKVASLADIIKSKRAAGRARDLAVLEVLEKTVDEAARHQKRNTGSSQEGK